MSFQVSVALYPCARTLYCTSTCSPRGSTAPQSKLERQKVWQPAEDPVERLEIHTFRCHSWKLEKGRCVAGRKNRKIRVRRSTMTQSSGEVTRAGVCVPCSLLKIFVYLLLFNSVLVSCFFNVSRNKLSTYKPSLPTNPSFPGHPCPLWRILTDLRLFIIHVSATYCNLLQHLPTYQGSVLLSIATSPDLLQYPLTYYNISQPIKDAQMVDNDPEGGNVCLGCTLNCGPEIFKCFSCNLT